jgi:hypothetical protein
MLGRYDMPRHIAQTGNRADFGSYSAKIRFVQHTTTFFLDRRYFTYFDLVASASGYVSRVAFLSTDSLFQWTILYRPYI